MQKKRYFKDELNYIKDDNNRKDLEYLITLLPDYFFSVSASSTGKYHPSFSLGNGGLLRHTKVVVKIAYELLAIDDRFTDNDKDLVIMAAVMHDGFKYGLGHEKYTRVDHPLISSKVIMEHSSKLKMDIDNVRKLCSLIETHMGIYNKDYKGNAILPLPRNELERFLHKCDYLASRKFLNIKFNNNEIIEEENDEKK